MGVEEEIDGICCAPGRAVPSARAATARVAREVCITKKTPTKTFRWKMNASRDVARVSRWLSFATLPVSPTSPASLPNVVTVSRFPSLSSREPPRAARARSFETPAGAARLLSLCQLGLFLHEASFYSARRARARFLVSPRRARGHSARRGASDERPGVGDVPRDDQRNLPRRARPSPRVSSRLGGSPASALAAALASEHLEKLAEHNILKRCRASPRCRG
jgi:hypothetical protein